MRTYQSCCRLRLRYIVTKDSFRCSECDKTNRAYDLTPPGAELDKAYKTRNKLKNEIFEQRARLSRLQKQLNQVNSKLARLGDWKAQNIQELEEDERLEAEKEGGMAENPESAIAPEDLFADPISPNTIAALKREFLQTDKTAVKAFHTS